MGRLPMEQCVCVCVRGVAMGVNRSLPTRALSYDSQGSGEATRTILDAGAISYVCTSDAYLSRRNFKRHEENSVSSRCVSICICRIEKRAYTCIMDI